jgi:hypothetical protein
LKKIETENCSQERHIDSCSKKPDIKRIIGVQLQRRRFYRKLTICFVGAFIIGCTAWLLLVMHRPTAPGDTAPEHRTIEQLVSKYFSQDHPANSLERQRPALEPARSNIGQAVRNGDHTSAPASKPESGGAVAGAAFSGTGKHDTPRSTIGPAANVPAAAGEKGKLAVEAVKTPQLRDRRLRLEGIAWSQVAAQRMAIISGRVVKEGQSVFGLEVTGIRQDGVMLTDGVKSWRLDFGENE